MRDESVFGAHRIQVIPWSFESPQSPPLCAICNDAGVLADRSDRQITKYYDCPDCIVRRTEERRSRLVAAIPPAFRRINLLDPSYVRDGAFGIQATPVNLWLNAERSILLHGAAGTGKTTLATAAYRWIIENTDVSTAEWTDVPTLFHTIRASYNHDTKTDNSDLLERCRVCDLLLIDDLGAQAVNDRNSAWIREQLYYVLNHRSNFERRTIFTSNMAPGALKGPLGEPIASRIVGMCGAYVITMGGKDVNHD